MCWSTCCRLAEQRGVISGDQEEAREATAAAAAAAAEAAAAAAAAGPPGAAAVIKDTLRILRSLGQLQKRDAAVLREAAGLLEGAAELKRLSVGVSLFVHCCLAS